MDRCVFLGSIASLVKGARLSADYGAAGTRADCFRLTHRFDLGIVILGFSAFIF